jgi:Tol biopolymer transport system component
LLALVEHSESVVLKDNLMKRVWPDTFVEESNLAQTIFVLRKALGESRGEQHYIVTVPGRGYRFVQRVRVVKAEENGEGPPGENPVESTGVAERAPVASAMRATRSTRRWISWATFAVLSLAIIAAIVFRPTVPPPRVLRIRQISQLGSLLYNTKVITDGPRIYFRAWEGHDRVIRYVAPAGGETFPVEKAFPNMDIDDISADGSEFLVVELNARGDKPPLWWVPVAAGSPRPVGTLHTRESKCSPDGQTLVYTVDSDLYLANSDGSNPRRFASLPGEAIYLHWSPDGKRLRFSVVDPRNGGTSLWEADVASNTVHALLPNWAVSRRAFAGGWTPDGRYFFFTAEEGGTSNVWALREPGEFLRRINPDPVELTAGPLHFYQPTPSKDGKSVFAVGEQMRGELLRYDTVSRQFLPYAQGRSADQVAFSHDAQWMAYIEFPEGVLVRSRLDGSDRRQLTFAPMRAFNPQWSPDGAQLAFEASERPGAARKIYTVPRAGGVPLLAAPNRQDRETYPSWSSQGNSIVFTSYEGTNSNPTLYILDLESKRATLLPGTAGLHMGQVSPDGSKIAALADLRLVLYDTASHNIRTVADVADFPRWSVDGAFVSFRTPYFRGPIENAGTFRWLASTNKIEKLAADPEFRLNGVNGVWSGLTPDGSLLVLRDLSSSDLYVLDVELP